MGSGRPAGGAGMKGTLRAQLALRDNDPWGLGRLIYE